MVEKIIGVPLETLDKYYFYPRISNYEEGIKRFTKEIQEGDNYSPESEIIKERLSQEEIGERIKEKTQRNRREKAHKYRNRGVCLRAIGKEKEAIKDFEKGLELNPKAGFYKEIGLTYLPKNPEEAIKMFSKAAELDDTYTPVLAQAYLEIGEEEKAEETITQIIKKIKKIGRFSEDKEDRLFFERSIARFCVKQGELEQAIEIYEGLTERVKRRTIGRDPRTADHYNEIGMAYWKKGDLKKARENFVNAREETQQDVLGAFNEAMVLLDPRIQEQERIKPYRAARMANDSLDRVLLHFHPSKEGLFWNADNTSIHRKTMLKLGIIAEHITTQLGEWDLERTKAIEKKVEGDWEKRFHLYGFHDLARKALEEKIFTPDEILELCSIEIPAEIKYELEERDTDI